MTNFEKYAEQIKDFFIKNFGIDKGNEKLVYCSHLCCINCIFGNRRDCKDSKRKWIDEEYVEPQVDWTKVAVDTPVLVRDYPEEHWLKRYFSRYENGTIYAFGNGATSWSAEYENNWNYAKLAEQE